MGSGASKPVGVPPHLEERFTSTRFMRTLWKTIKIDLAPLVFVSLNTLDTLTSIPRSNDKVTVGAHELPPNARAVFVSHRWFRPWHTKKECLDNGHEWAGHAHPDDAQGTKLALIRDGCRELAKAMGWDESQVYCWIDFCCVEQDDVPRKIAGIDSLLGYAAACDAVLIPCAEVPPSEGKTTVDMIPGGYGERGWTRLESMTFQFVSAFLPRPPEGMPSLINAVARLPEGGLFHKQFTYEMGDDDKKPSRGILYSEDDRDLIRGREKMMIDCVRDNLGNRDAVTHFANHNTLRFLKMGDQGVRKLTEAALKPIKTPDGTWTHNNALRTLNLQANEIRAEGAKALAGALAPRQNPDGTWTHNNALSTLYLWGNRIGDEGAEALADALAPRQNPDGTWTHNNALSTLNLGCNKIGAEGAEALAGALAPRQNPDGTWTHNNALSTLFLKWNGIGAEGAKALADALAPRQNPDGTWTHNNALSYLILFSNYIGDEGAKALAGALAPRQNPDGTWTHNSALRTLNLRDTKIGAEGAKALADALAPRQNPDGTWTHNNALTDLGLGGNMIGDEGAEALAGALAPRQNPDGTWTHNNALSTLDLRGNEIGAEGAKALAGALANRQNPDGTWTHNNALTDLGLGDNNIGDEGAEALADALAPRQNPDGTWTHNNALSTLILLGNMIGDEGDKALENLKKELENHRPGNNAIRIRR